MIQNNMQRNHYFDFLRGLAIMMVIGIHTFLADGIDLSKSFSMSAFIRQALNCAVPIFLAISGYFLCSKLLDTWTERKMFWRKQLPKVYVPALIASLPYFALSVVRGGDLIQSIAMTLICGFSIYYFIALIIQYYALLPFLRNVKLRGVIFSACISFASIIALTYMTKISGVELLLIGFAGPFPVWLIFFVIGIYLRNNKRNYSLILPIILLILGLLLQYMETRFWNINYGGGFGIKLSAFIYSLLIIVVLFSNKSENLYRRNIITKIVEYIGSISFAIYLYHMFTTYSFGILHINDLSWLIRWGACLIMTIIIVEVMKRIIPKKSHWYFGL